MSSICAYVCTTETRRNEKSEDRHREKNILVYLRGLRSPTYTKTNIHKKHTTFLLTIMYGFAVYKRAYSHCEHKMIDDAGITGTRPTIARGTRHIERRVKSGTPNLSTSIRGQTSFSIVGTPPPPKPPHTLNNSNNSTLSWTNHSSQPQTLQ